MAYEPTEWKKGDKITAEKMNKLESGVADNNNTKILILDPNAFNRYSIQLEPNLPLSYFIGAYVSVPVENSEGWFFSLIQGYDYQDKYWFHAPEPNIDSEWSNLTYTPNTGMFEAYYE